jgi:hypothetical protein
MTLETSVKSEKGVFKVKHSLFCFRRNLEYDWKSLVQFVLKINQEDMLSYICFSQFVFPFVLVSKIYFL